MTNFLHKSSREARDFPTTTFMKKFRHKSSNSPPPPKKKKRSSSRGRGGGAHWGERQMAKFLHKSSPGERDYFYDQFPS